MSVISPGENITFCLVYLDSISACDCKQSHRLAVDSVLHGFNRNALRQAKRVATGREYEKLCARVQSAIACKCTNAIHVC